MLKQYLMLPSIGTGIISRNVAAELGEGGSNRNYLDEKLPMNVSDVTVQLS